MSPDLKPLQVQTHRFHGHSEIALGPKEFDSQQVHI